MSTNEQRRYRFGPLERRGVIGSLRPAQVGVIAFCLVVGVILMRALTGGLGLFAAFVLALLAIAFCFWPVEGRSLEEWMPVVYRHVSRRVRGRHVQFSASPQAGTRVDTNGRPEAGVGLPESVRNV